MTTNDDRIAIDLDHQCITIRVVLDPVTLKRYRWDTRIYGEHRSGFAQSRELALAEAKFAVDAYLDKQTWRFEQIRKEMDEKIPLGEKT